MSHIRTFFAGATTMAAALAAVFALTGAKTERKASFDEITVGRINVVEPDGTKRVIISNMAQFPGDFRQGQEHARPDRRNVAGLLFVNEEGSENGGLVQNGNMGADGKVDSGLSLSFDRFRQDQALQLMHEDSVSEVKTGIKINDVPAYKETSLDDLTRFAGEAGKLPQAQRAAYWKQKRVEGRLSENRIWLGNTTDKGATLELKDAKGRVRMMLLVSAEGKAEIRMLDEHGKVTKAIDPTSKE